MERTWKIVQPSVRTPEVHVGTLISHRLHASAILAVKRTPS